MTSIPDGAIGSTVWPFTAKLTEEAAELLQVLGKLSAYPDPDCNHPDGTHLPTRLEEELGDVLAVIELLQHTNPTLDPQRVTARKQQKLRTYLAWHQEEQAREDTARP